MRDDEKEKKVSQSQKEKGAIYVISSNETLEMVVFDGEEEGTIRMP